jgi:ribosomal protein S18 acetylase RimI-like enzyme
MPRSCHGYNTDMPSPELWMLDLFVEAPWRSRGIGRALVVAVARETVRRGSRLLQWGVRRDNHRAKKFYRSLGAESATARVAASSAGR